MVTKLTSLSSLLIVAAVLIWELPVRTASGQEPSASQAAWTLDEAMHQLRLYPDDAYLQYVALQLAHRDGVTNEIKREITRLTNANRPAWRQRAESVNLFSLFSGSLAVQESLQLETMTGEVPDPRRTRGNTRSQRFDPDSVVSISELQGPTIKSHPWTEMLDGREPEMSTLASYVPEDQYYVRFESVATLLDVMDLSDTWGEHLHSQTSRKAYSSLVGQRVMQQLALETNGLLRPFYDLVVNELAITGNDLYIREGSDITLLFRFEQPQVFRTQMEAFLSAAERSRGDATRSDHEYRGIPYTFVGTPDRRVHVFSAYLTDDIHLRSNSEVGLRRVIDVMLDEGSGLDTSHAQSDEFAYIRTLMPHGADAEDGFVYLSDPFIRRLVGPELKLTERRRVLCYNHLRMIGHACALYETEHGHPPESIDDLAEAKCCPGHFNEGNLACPCGGRYSLSEDHHTGVCSHHGRVETMVPCCEIAETSVSGAEARMYEDFVTDYNQYWRTFFDPIAIRVTATPKQYRLETIILPLINNSLYQGMAMSLGGEPAQLDLTPIPDRNIFSVAFQLNKQQLLALSGLRPPDPDAGQQMAVGQIPRTAVDRLRQIGIAMHSYHSAHSRFPAVANFDDNGSPLLSWRVHLLPFLGQEQLYNQFRLHEPWDSPHNKALIERIPDVYQPAGKAEGKAGRTNYLALVGDGTIFDGSDKGVRIADITDGTSQTVMLIDAPQKHAVIWTRPHDVDVGAASIRSHILGRYAEDGLVVMTDGSTRRVRPTENDDSFRRAVVRNDGEASGQFGEPVAVRRRNRGGIFGLSDMGIDNVDEQTAYEFLTRGVGNKIGLHVYDGEPTFDFALTRFLGQAMGSFSGRNRFDDNLIPVFLVVASLNSPVYVSLPLDDVDVTDRFLAELDQSLALMARRNEPSGWFRVERDFYTLPIDESVTARSASITLGPIKWRFFWARIEDVLYVSSKPEVLQDLAALHAADDDGTPADATKAHALIRIRPQNWNQMLSNFRLGWGESHRLACLDNVGRLSSLSRLVAAGGGDVSTRAHQLYGVDFFCPCGGHYAADNAYRASCSVHGTAANPQQPEIDADGGAINALLGEFDGMTLSLTFLEDGLHATLNVDRQ